MQISPQAAHATYQQAQIGSAGPLRIVVLLYEGALQFSRQALEKFDEPAVRGHALGRAHRIVSELFASLDTDGDGSISVDELRVGLQRQRTGEPTLSALLAAAEPPAGVDFADLATAPGGCCRIADTAQRAISLEQLRALVMQSAKLHDVDAALERLHSLIALHGVTGALPRCVAHARE